MKITVDQPYAASGLHPCRLSLLLSIAGTSPVIVVAQPLSAILSGHISREPPFGGEKVRKRD